MYNATRDIFGNPIDLTIEPNWVPIPGFNDGTYSDRVLYARRKSSTRAKVNWSRGAPTRTSPPAGSNPDSTVAPHQTTSYDTSDDPNATPDAPAGDGNGSRHNYTAIGQVNMTYDKRRNLLADGTREFRYSYNNQLRKVWRKSDGDSTLTGRVAEYREDAFGRQVYNHSHWEMSVRKYLDTRFELDVNVDADGDTAAMTLIDGGMHGTLNPTFAANLQTSSWSARITKPAGANEAHYFDFLVDVPNPGGTAYLGYVSYDQIELRVFANRYELWQTGGQNPLGTYSATTAGRRNIGLRAGDNGGVWVNGTQIFWGISLQPNPQAGFASKAVQTGPDTYTPGLILFENLCYVRGFNRGVPVENSVPTNGTPRVVTRQFDGPRPVTVRQPISSGSSDLVVNYTEDATKAESKAEDGEMEDHLFLPNGRRTTGQVVKAGEDLVTYQGESRTVLGPGEEMPGVCIGLHVDAVGAITPNLRTSSTDTMEWCCFGATTTSFDFASIPDLSSFTTGFGPFGGAEVGLTTSLTAVPGSAQPIVDGSINTEDGASINSDTMAGGCACRCVSSSDATVASRQVDSAIATNTTLLGSHYSDDQLDLDLAAADDTPEQKLQKHFVEKFIEAMKSIAGARGAAFGGMGEIQLVISKADYDSDEPLRKKLIELAKKLGVDLIVIDEKKETEVVSRSFQEVQKGAEGAEKTVQEVKCGTAKERSNALATLFAEYLEYARVDCAAAVRLAFLKAMYDTLGAEWFERVITPGTREAKPDLAGMSLDDLAKLFGTSLDAVADGAERQAGDIEVHGYNDADVAAANKGDDMNRENAVRVDKASTASGKSSGS